MISPTWLFGLSSWIRYSGRLSEIMAIEGIVMLRELQVRSGIHPGIVNFCALMASMVALGLSASGCQTPTGPSTALESPHTLYLVRDLDAQPLVAASQRLKEALTYLGSALSQEDQAKLDALAAQPLSSEVAEAVQQVLDPYCLAMVQINPEARVKVEPGPARPILVQDGWKSYLIKVHNESGTRAPLAWQSPNAEPSLHVSTGAPDPRPESEIPKGERDTRFLELALYEKRPLTRELTGYPLEYKVLQVYTNETGLREATLGFHVGQGTQDIGFRNALHVLFDCLPSVKVKLNVRDTGGEPAMASFIFRDNIERLVDNSQGPALPGDYRQNKALQVPWQRPGVGAEPLVGVYPLPSRRVADGGEYPDFFFQPQVYRTDGEHVYLPPGRYQVTYGRGPEYLPATKTIVVPEGVSTHTETFELERWIHLAKLGWYSADHHVHGGGCSHYESPEAGVRPEAMLRQAQGEDLNISCVLTWGPCWYYQKTFFEGEVSNISTKENLMRYDVEVSGFPSSHAGHLCLLRLNEDDYPGTSRIEEWPSWTLPVLQWGKQQGGIVGYSHSGWGLEPMEATNELPNYVMAKFDGIGANEYVVTAVHDAVDFISAGDTPVQLELNIWYHLLNCDLRAAISGETDYPCIFDERVGMARSYAKITGALDFDAFTEKIADGANYVSDGRAHILDFKVDAAEMGIDGSEVHLATPGAVTVTATVAAYLDPTQDAAGAEIVAQGTNGRPYWHVEKARIGQSRKVPIELVVNGYAVARREIEADGAFQPITFQQDIPASSWVALRILASVHTNPIFVLVGGKPLRASKRSAAWCRAAVDRCWQMKEPAIRKEEKATAQAAYDVARQYYDKVMTEAVDDTQGAGPEPTLLVGAL